MTAGAPDRPRGIDGQFINPARERAGRDAAHLEFLHLFDIVDALFGVEPDVVVGRPDGDLTQVSVRYPGPMTAPSRWAGARRAAPSASELVYADGGWSPTSSTTRSRYSAGTTSWSDASCEAAPTALFDQLRAFARGLA